MNVIKQPDVLHLNEGFTCSLCDYKCFYKSEWTRHIQTRKHIAFTTSYDNSTAIHSLRENVQYKCPFCGNMYKTSSGLWKHKRKCNWSATNEPNGEHSIISLTNNVIKELINEHKDMKTLIMEQNNTINNLVKNGIINNTNNITNSNNNSNNKTFNLHFFLNETCKDAMNITDFVNSIQLQLADLENVGRLGYVDGISNIIVKHLKALDVEKRPVHCTDPKREILYIKDNNKWEKEDDENKTMRKAIKKVAFRNSILLPEYKACYPECVKSSSKHSDHYNKLIIESMGGSGDNDFEKENKIIKNVAKGVLIDKEKYKI
jgi:hypothetical protein